MYWKYRTAENFQCIRFCGSQTIIPTNLHSTFFFSLEQYLPSDLCPSNFIACKMADPLSVVASLGGLIMIGTRVSFVVSSFIESINSVPAQLKILSIELSTLVRVLTDLHSILHTSSEILDSVPGLTESELSTVVSGCLAILVELQGLVHKYTSMTDGKLARTWKQFQWFQKEKEIDALIKGLEMYKLTLTLTLNIANQ